MNKTELLKDIRAALNAQTISKEDLRSIISAEDSNDLIQEKTEPKSNLNTAQVLQYFGGAIVLFGIIILVSNHWNELNDFARIITTLGASLAAFIIAFIFQRRPDTSKLPAVFHFLALLLLPIGLLVTFNAWSINFNTDLQILSFELILIAVYGMYQFFSKKVYYSVPLILAATAAFFTITAIISGDYSSSNFYGYRFLVVGSCYILLGQFYLNQFKKTLAAVWNTIGALVVFSSALVLGGWRSTEPAEIIWEIIFPILIFGGIYYSVYFKNTRALVICAIFLIIWILKISSEYFAQSLGWPVALVVAGLLIIAVGYFSTYLNQKYIKGPAALPPEVK